MLYLRLLVSYPLPLAFLTASEADKVLSSYHGIVIVRGQPLKYTLTHMHTHAHARTRTSSPQINFLLGVDGEPWVMGEHLNDPSYEELVKWREGEEAEREKMAELQDRKEAEELAKQETRDILSLASESLVMRWCNDVIHLLYCLRSIPY